MVEIAGQCYHVSDLSIVFIQNETEYNCTLGASRSVGVDTMPVANLQRNTQLPHASSILRRQRLLDKLEGIADYKLTLISAPPGYGKTTLAAQFAHQSSYPVAWHAITERDRDVPNLHMRCLSVLRHIVPGIHTLKPRYGYSSGELAALVTDYLHEKLTERIVYVLDDVQHLAGSPAAEGWLRTLVSQVPGNCHIILVSRILPDLPFAEMIARREVLPIGQEELRLDPKEIHDLARKIQGAPLPKKQVLELSSRLEGWPAGTVLALHPLPASLERAMFSDGEGPEALFYELAALMLEAQPPELRDFLLASSTLRRMTPELCAGALQLTRSYHWLEDARTHNLFLSRVSGGLVYHALFRDFLQRQLKVNDPGLFVELHTSAARFFETHDQIDEAFDHYVQAELYEYSAAIAERVAQAYFTQGKVETLLAWAHKLADSSVEIPRLLCTCAKIHTDRYDYKIAKIQLDTAERGFERNNDTYGLADVQLQRAMINLQEGAYREAEKRANALLEMAPESTKLCGQALRVLGYARLRLGDVEMGSRDMERALPLHRQDGDAYALTNLMLDLYIAYMRLGRFDDAASCLQEVVALRRSIGGASALALALNNLGYHYHQHGDYHQAMVTLQEGLSVIVKSPNRRAESYLLWSMGDLQRDRGAFEEAEQLYNKGLELIGSNEPALRCAILVSASTLRRWQNQPKEAVTLAQEALKIAGAHNLALEGAMAEATIWMARAQLGEATEGLEQLHRIAADLRKRGVQIEHMPVYILCAHAALLCSDQAAAESALEIDLRGGQMGSSMQSVAAEVIHTPLLRKFIVNNAARYPEFMPVLKQLGDAQLQTQPGVAKFSRSFDWGTYSLRITTFGQEIIERDGSVISPSEWRTVTARELFLYLLFYGSHDREQISLEFWPDSAPRQVRASFHTTLYRARQALGENTIVFQDNVYLVNPELDIWCDAQELERLVRQARHMPPRDARTEDLWQRAVNLYQGDFLPSLDADWVFTRREALREVYLEALTGLGECAQARQDFRTALHSYKSALSVDPYRENIHRMIMTCYGQTGEKEKIITHLKDLERLLQQDLAVDPSEQTLAHARTLLH
jgi:LuxR family transcriptional regulator, maltose regulon positive regulatory protein